MKGGKKGGTSQAIAAVHWGEAVWMQEKQDK